MLTFEAVDDIALAAERRRPTAAFVHALQVQRIGPLVEYSLLRQAYGLPALPDSKFAASLGRVLTGARSPGPTDLRSRDAELARVPAEQQHLADAPEWLAFVKRLHAAALDAGFARPICNGMAGAFIELVENVFVHSRRPTSGVVGYRHDGPEFELVVADEGEGVLNSLRRHPDYAGLTDAGTALTYASKGHSRLGPGHGNGFRTLFVTLASLHGEVRLRSGDHSVELVGTNVNVDRASVRMRPAFQGLLVSVACRAG